MRKQTKEFDHLKSVDEEQLHVGKNKLKYFISSRKLTLGDS